MDVPSLGRATTLPNLVSGMNAGRRGKERTAR
jgi:hypothetical protein